MIHTTLIALGGQTSSGKSEMAVNLAKELKDCWIINCDSRQIYKYLNLGTGKVSGSWEMIVHNNQLIHTFLYQEIPHFFIDCIDPTKQYSLTDFLADFCHFCQHHDLPNYLILCGGTGLYIKAILERYTLNKLDEEFEDDYNQEKTKLSKKSLLDLQKLYSEYYPNQVLNDSDFQNSRRLINKLLTYKSNINNWSKAIVLPMFTKTYNFAIETDQKSLYERIEQRILKRIHEGMIKEVESLQFLGKDRLLDLGLEYRMTYLYLMGQLTYSEYINKLTTHSINYAQRQLTWLKKQPIMWIDSAQDILNRLKD
ncbi:MAG: hypothetical protein H7196_03580 [candidate division SR1 bacterium]|nr:hypothetical protein [candidate division SR1 bacterium]